MEGHLIFLTVHVAGSHGHAVTHAHESSRLFTPLSFLPHTLPSFTPSTWYKVPLFFPIPPLYCELASAYQRKHLPFGFLGLAYFTHYNILQFHPFTCKCHRFILLQDWVIFHCAYIPQFLYPFILEGHLGWLHSLAIVSWAAINMDVAVSL